MKASLACFAGAVFLSLAYFGYQSVGRDATTSAAVRQVGPTPQTGDVPSPAGWVPFDATARRTDSDGKVNMVGRFYRASDGSTRLDTGPAGGPIGIIDIKNISNSTQYVMQSTGKWVSYRMKLPSSGYRPLKRRTTVVGLEPYAETIEGFELYRYASANAGPIAFQAPSLNFFALVTEFNGTRQEYHDVRIREQPKELFFPTPGTAVEDSGEYGGIVSNPDSIGFVPGHGHPTH